jgi:hypothetical protein
VSISFARGGRPEARLSDREIRHLVRAAGEEDIVAGEIRDGWLAGDGGVLRRYLVEGIVERLSTYSCCSGGNPRIWFSIPDDGGTVVSFSLLRASFEEKRR